MIIIKKLRLQANSVVTTMDLLEDKDMMTGSLIDVSKVNKGIKDYQTVVAVGPLVRNISIGDLVHIDPSRYAKPYHNKTSISEATEKYNTVESYLFKTIEIDGVPHLKIFDSDIDYIVEEYEEVEDFNPNPVIVTEEQLKGKPKIILN